MSQRLDRWKADSGSFVDSPADHNQTSSLLTVHLLCVYSSVAQMNSDPLSPGGIQFEPCMIKCELNAYLEGRNK